MATNVKRATFSKLSSNACNENASMAGITAASREEKACCETPLLIELVRDGASYRRFACTRPSTQPEYAALVFTIYPLAYLLKDFNPSSSQAVGVVLSVERIEWSIGGKRKFVQWVLERCCISQLNWHNTVDST
jgi:hypothetical protein